MTAPALTRAELRTVDLLDDLDDDEVDEWLAVATPREAGRDELIAEQGQPLPGVVFLLEGEARNFVFDGARAEPAGRQVAPTWLGAIAALTGGSLGVRIQASTTCRLAVIPSDEFVRLALAQPSVHRRVMRQVGPVMSRIASFEQSRERLTSLGTMAAGLAHELNNPAAAARRAADQLAEALDVVASTIGRFVESGVERSEAEELVRLQEQAVALAAAGPRLDGMAAADAEEQLLERLTELGVAEPWRLAEPLAAVGLEPEWLERVAAAAEEATPAALEWVAATLTARSLAEELAESTKRMSSLVGAVKSYAYLDRGGRVEADLHEGLETTVTILGHKLKHTRIEVVREYDRELPRFSAGSDLNQVWTNLLDNAIDAVGETGRITITTRREREFAVVEITDDGPGIPPEIREQIFDSFFTTKDVGKGSGLGLATARGIVVDRYDGTLDVESEPGRTTFRVWLPLG